MLEKDEAAIRDAYDLSRIEEELAVAEPASEYGGFYRHDMDRLLSLNSHHISYALAKNLRHGA